MKKMNLNDMRNIEAGLFDVFKWTGMYGKKNVGVELSNTFGYAFLKFCLSAVKIGDSTFSIPKLVGAYLNMWGLDFKFGNVWRPEINIDED